MKQTAQFIALRLMAAIILAAGLLPCHAADFSRWRGEHSNGSVADPGVELISSWSEARVVWASEVKSPHPYDVSIVRAMGQWPRNNLANGGLCMPALWNGNVYEMYWRGGGDVVAEDAEGSYNGM